MSTVFYANLPEFFAPVCRGGNSANGGQTADRSRFQHDAVYEFPLFVVACNITDHLLGGKERMPENNAGKNAKIFLRLSKNCTNYIDTFWIVC